MCGPPGLFAVGSTTRIRLSPESRGPRALTFTRCGYAVQPLNERANEHDEVPSLERTSWWRSYEGEHRGTAVWVVMWLFLLVLITGASAKDDVAWW